LAQIVKEIADSDFAVLIDDFHYMPRKIQAEAAKQIKTAAERGVRILGHELIKVIPSAAGM